MPRAEMLYNVFLPSSKLKGCTLFCLMRIPRRNCWQSSLFCVVWLFNFFTMCANPKWMPYFCDVLRRAHSVTVLLVMLCVLVYVGIFEKPYEDGEYNTKRLGLTCSFCRYLKSTSVSDWQTCAEMIFSF